MHLSGITNNIIRYLIDKLFALPYDGSDITPSAFPNMTMMFGEQSISKCSRCNRSSTKETTAFTLSLAIKKHMTIQETIKENLAKENIPDYECEQCSKEGRGQQLASRVSVILRNMLFIQTTAGAEVFQLSTKSCHTIKKMEFQPPQ